ncbi:MAG: polymer-forming cytoskeletal protein [Spirochaetaceae bacterium]|nr:polymer-forming cytoskeletal protein [Spirochaetaceae bacterium]
MAEVNIKNVEEADIDTILSEDIDFTGELTFKKPLMIKGKFNGTIKSLSDLYIGKNAVIKAEVDANIVSIKGNIEGNITSNKRVELFSTSQITGDISSPTIVMENGAILNGICTMEKK